jgi:hypothetical protein
MAVMISVSQCAAYAELASSELFVGPALSDKHYFLLESYLLNLKRGGIAVRNMICADLRAFLDLGAHERAADMLLVLRLFLSKHPAARYEALPRGLSAV